MKIISVELHRHLEERLTQFGRELPGPMTGFARLRKKAVEGGALSAKVKEMMGGGPGSIYAAHALDAVEQFLSVPEPTSAATA